MGLLLPRWMGQRPGSPLQLQGTGCWGPSFLSSTCPQGPEVSSGPLLSALIPLNPVLLLPAVGAGGEQEGSQGWTWLLREKCAACQMLHPSERAVLS